MQKLPMFGKIDTFLRNIHSLYHTIALAHLSNIGNFVDFILYNYYNENNWEPTFCLGGI